MKVLCSERPRLLAQQSLLRHLDLDVVEPFDVSTGRLESIASLRSRIQTEWITRMPRIRVRMTSETQIDEPLRPRTWAWSSNVAGAGVLERRQCINQEDELDEKKNAGVPSGADRFRLAQRLSDHVPENQEEPNQMRRLLRGLVVSFTQIDFTSDGKVVVPDVARNHLDVEGIVNRRYGKWFSGGLYRSEPTCASFTIAIDILDREVSAPRSSEQAAWYWLQEDLAATRDFNGIAIGSNDRCFAGPAENKVITKIGIIGIQNGEGHSQTHIQCFSHMSGNCSTTKFSSDGIVFIRAASGQKGHHLGGTDTCREQNQQRCNHQANGFLHVKLHKNRRSRKAGFGTLVRESLPINGDAALMGDRQ